MRQEPFFVTTTGVLRSVASLSPYGWFGFADALNSNRPRIHVKKKRQVRFLALFPVGIDCVDWPFGYSYSNASGWFNLTVSPKKQKSS
jgi:hypothetical protein